MFLGWPARHAAGGRSAIHRSCWYCTQNIIRKRRDANSNRKQKPGSTMPGTEEPDREYPEYSGGRGSGKGSPGGQGGPDLPNGDTRRGMCGMSRGMPSEKALDAARNIARARGRVVTVESWEGRDCDFLIEGPYGLAAITVRRTRRIRAGPAEIAERFRETLNAVRAGGHCGGVAGEFWLWSPYGTMRFFAVEGFELVELTRFGLPLMPPVTGKFSGMPATGQKTPKKNPGTAPAGADTVPEQRTPEIIPGSDTHAGAPCPAGTSAGRPAPPEPLPVRYLRWRNAEIRRKEEEGKTSAGQQKGPGPAHDPSGRAGDPLAGDGQPHQ
jgi:hypothetical protein